MKKLMILIGLISFILILGIEFQGCVVTKKIEAKSGAQLWGENCIRCHNIPSPTDFSDDQWELIGTHMRLRANLTEMEASKIIDFLKIAN